MLANTARDGVLIRNCGAAVPLRIPYTGRHRQCPGERPCIHQESQPWWAMETSGRDGCAASYKVIVEVLREWGVREGFSQRAGSLVVRWESRYAAACNVIDE